MEILFLQLQASEQLPFIPACCANVIIFHKAAGGEESGGSTAGQGSANFLHKRSDSKYLRLCRPYGLCCNQSALPVSWKAATDNSKLDVPSKLYLWALTLTLHVIFTLNNVKAILSSWAAWKQVPGPIGLTPVLDYAPWLSHHMVWKVMVLLTFYGWDQGCWNLLYSIFSDSEPRESQITFVKNCPLNFPEAPLVMYPTGRRLPP